MHLKRVTIHPDKFPSTEQYPFNLQLFHNSGPLDLNPKVTLFVGENGTGKSTLLEAITQLCGIHIWRDSGRSRVNHSPFEKQFYKYISVEWAGERVTGSFFGSSIFQHFAQIVDEWSAADPGQLEYFGGKSLITQSHGQSLMSFFRSRYQIKGIYLLDEPETALSPGTQLELLDILTETSRHNQAQFIIATHSPILLAHPDSTLYCFNDNKIKQITYEETEHYKIYKSFMEDRSKYIK